MKTHPDIEQGSEAWRKVRAGKPTSSKFSCLVNSEGKVSESLIEYARELAAEAYAGEPVDAWLGNQHTEHGKEIEAEAIRAYEFDNDVTVERVGFVTNDAETYGCSPDGLVGDGLIEIKCLMAKHHVAAILYFKKHGRAPTNYVQQTQGQMMICGRQWCDLVFYHPVLPLLVIRETPNSAVQTGLIAQIKNVIEERDEVLAAIKELA